MPDLEQLLADLISGEDARAESAAKELSKHGAPAVQALTRLQSNPDEDQRWWATRALAACNHAQVQQALMHALADPSPAVRQCAALGLRTNPNPDAISLLLDALQAKDRLLARLAGDALVALGPLALEPLAQTLQEGSPAQRGEAARALASIDLPEAIPILYAAVDDPSSIVQYWIDEGLNRLGVGMVFFKP